MPKIESSRNGALKKKDETPPVLKPYISLGVDLNWTKTSKEANGPCPFCSTEKKFFVKTANDQWNCRVCGVGSSRGGGNIYTFMNLLLTAFQKETTDNEIKKLAFQRNVVNSKSLAKWGVAKSYLTNEWMFPGYNLNDNKEARLVQLYRYSLQGDKYRLLATPELKHSLFGVNLYNKSCKTVFLTEGPWDAVVLRETLVAAKMIKGVSVLAAPGCNVFNSGWNKYFENKKAIICFDNDYPKKNKNTQREIEPPGFAGVKRTAGILATAQVPPKEIKYLYWGDEGYTTEFDNGMDIRDFLCQK